jgi:hypothetical protein
VAYVSAALRTGLQDIFHAHAVAEVGVDEAGLGLAVAPEHQGRGIVRNQPPFRWKCARSMPKPQYIYMIFWPTQNTGPKLRA